MMKAVSHQKWLKALVIGFASFLLIALFSGNQLLKGVELKSLDFKFFLRGFVKADTRLFLIGIDDFALDKLGRWPWKRSYHAALLESLSGKPPASLGFDILFNEPDEAHNESDQALFQISRLFDRLVFAGYFRQGNSPRRGGQEQAGDVEKWRYQALEKNQIHPIDVSDLSLLPHQSFRIPLKDLSLSSHVGFINAPADLDGLIRKVPMILKYGNQLFPSFSLRLIMDYFNISSEDLQVVHDWKGIYLRLLTREGDCDIPIDRQGYYKINFRSDLGDFSRASFIQLLKEPTDLSKTIAVVGITATGIADFAPTPLSTHTPLVLMHLNAVQNILQRDFLNICSKGLEFLILFLMTLLTSLVSYLARRVWASLGSTMIFMAYAIGNFIIFDRANVHLSWVFPSLGILLTYLISTTLRYWIEEKEKRYVKKAFQRYVSPGILEAVLKDAKHLKLGGKRENLTVLFSDIRMFSSYCETRDPEEVVAMLNEYFDVMTKIVFDNGGTLDKYIGDGLMVIFGAPVALKMDHALAAVESAYQMQEKMKELKVDWTRQGKEPISIGVGINTGPMVVGNMGSSHVMNYTVVGDEVNLAARLEGLTRQFNVDIIIGQATYDHIHLFWETRFLGEVKVKGREKTEKIYEVVGRRVSK